MTINLTVNDKEYKKIENAASLSGKPVQNFLSDIISKYSAEIENIKQDPMYLMEGYDSDAPDDLASNHDFYLYGK